MTRDRMFAKWTPVSACTLLVLSGCPSSTPTGGGGVEEPRPLECNDGDPCTEDREVSGECEFTLINCSDRDACTRDECVDGSCVHEAIDCDDDDACTDDSCAGGSCRHVSISCSDNDPCTVDSCRNGSCRNVPVDCSDDDLCTLDSCVDGECLRELIDCDDDDPCTQDECEAGLCNNEATDCDDGDPCTTDGCEPNTGSCISIPIECPPGHDCIDGTCIGNPPVAEAGPDQNLLDIDGDWAEIVTLDGSASFAPASTVSAMTWSLGGVVLGSGSSPTVQLLRGTNVITLEVTDENNLSATDTVTVIISPVAPEVVQLAITVSADIALGAFPIEVVTPINTAHIGAPGTSAVTTLLSSSASRIVFLSNSAGETIAPALIRPEDEVAGQVDITAQRIALGFVALHPIFSQLSLEDREAVFDACLRHPNLAFMESVIASTLMRDPVQVADETVVPELFASIQPILDDVLPNVLPSTRSFGASKRQVTAQVGESCSARGDEVTFAVQPGSGGTAIFANPRNVFYGVDIVGPAGAEPVQLVSPKGGIFRIWPPSFTPPSTECMTLSDGYYDFDATAYGATLDLSTGAGRATAANAVYAVTYIVDFFVPIPFKSEIADRATELAATATGDQSLPVWLEDFKSGFSVNKSVNEIIDFLLDKADDHWDRIAFWLWQQLPAGTSTEVGLSLTKFTKKLGGILKSVTKFLSLNEIVPFVVDTINGIGEGTLHYCLTNQEGVVTASCTSSFGAQPRFSWAPATGSIGLPMQFDPSATLLTGGGTAAYEWFFDDFDGFDFVDTFRGGPEVVEHAFSQAGLHIVRLRVSADGHSYQVSNYVPVSLFPNIGFETGTEENWSVETHTWRNATPGSASSHSNIVQVGNDSVAGNQLTRVWSGRYALRIENSSGGEYISSASRTFIIPPGGAVLKFAWAAVLEDPQHEPHEQPYFDILVRNEDSGQDLYYIHHYSGEPGYPWNAAGSWKYTPWQPVELDLSLAGGQAVTVKAIAADCSLGGHGGYVYLDAFEGQ